MSSEDEAGQVCIANIGPRERRKRMVSGVVGIVAGLAVGALLVASGGERWTRLVLLLPFWMGGLGVFQAQGHT